MNFFYYNLDKNCSKCPGSALCVANVQCPALMRPGVNVATCHLPGGRDGVCCTTGRNHTSQYFIIQKKKCIYAAISKFNTDLNVQNIINRLMLHEIGFPTAQEDLKKARSSSVDEKHLTDAKSKSKMKLAHLAAKEQKIIANDKHKTVVTRGQPTFGHFQVTIIFNDDFEYTL